MGRLVLVFERQLSEPTRLALRDLLGRLWESGDVTWVSGLNRASMLEAGSEGDGLFYNRDFVSPEQAVTLMPWREVWLVAAGQTWRLVE